MTSPFPVPQTAEKKSAQEAEEKRARSDILLDGLNDAQRAAVSHPGGPLLVVAGAGSGKTRVLTRRVAWLIAARGAHPGSILAITFTNKAAAEMRERVAELVGPRARMMWVSTFHSACVRILRREATKFGFTSSFTIYDSADQRRLMTQVCRDMDLDPKRVNPRAVLNWISNLKNELVDHEAAGSKADEPDRGALRRGLHHLSGAAAGRQRDGLRRPDHEHGPPVPGRGPTSPRPIAGGSGTSWSTSTKTPTTRSTS